AVPRRPAPPDPAPGGSGTAAHWRGPRPDRRRRPAGPWWSLCPDRWRGRAVPSDPSQSLTGGLDDALGVQAEVVEQEGRASRRCERRDAQHAYGDRMTLRDDLGDGGAQTAGQQALL